MYTPHFSITSNLLTYISRIEAAKALIDNAPLVPAWEAKFRDDALMRTVHFGTKIEGNELTQAQAQKVTRLHGTIDTKEAIEKTGVFARERDIQEVINYRNVLAWINRQSIVDISEAFTAETLKTIHEITIAKLIEPDYAGTYRDKQVVVRSAQDGSVVFRPPVSVEIPYLIEQFFKWTHSDEAARQHAVIRAAITQYQLVYIHPFIEGNGRSARAMSTLLLYVLGYDFKRFFSIEQYFDSDVSAYYEALLSVQQSPETDMTYWLEYFCYGLALEIEKVKNQVMKLSKDLKLKKQLGKQVALSERQIILLELFQQQEAVTSDDAQKALPMVSVDTILRDIRDLIKKNIIQKKGVTKGVRYTLVE